MNTDSALVIESLKLQLQLVKQEEYALMRSINRVATGEGLAPVYHESLFEDRPAGLGSIRSDAFYGKALNTSITKILEARNASGMGPATPREIFDALQAGGFQFATTNEKAALDGLRITLGKSTNTFHKLWNGTYGMLSWYPDIRAEDSAESPKRARTKKTKSKKAKKNKASNDHQKGATDE